MSKVFVTFLHSIRFLVTNISLHFLLSVFISVTLPQLCIQYAFSKVIHAVCSSELYYLNPIRRELAHSLPARPSTQHLPEIGKHTSSLQTLAPEDGRQVGGGGGVLARDEMWQAAFAVNGYCETCGDVKNFLLFLGLFPWI